MQNYSKIVIKKLFLTVDAQNLYYLVAIFQNLGY